MFYLYHSYLCTKILNVFKSEAEPVEPIVTHLVDVGRGLDDDVGRGAERVDAGVDLVEGDGARHWRRVVDQVGAVAVHPRAVVL